MKATAKSRRASCRTLSAKENGVASWTDPQLGMFKFNEYQWEKTIEIEAFSIFPYGGFGNPNEDNSSSNIVLGIEAEDECEIPSEQVIEVARLTIKNHQYLLREGIKALFNDLIGKGPDSGMWWHSAIDHVREIVANRVDESTLAVLNKPEDLHALLGKPSIRVQEFGYGYDDPCSIISFEAVFEPEHGIGILTDGTQILGVGYEMDVSPFNQ